jgi:hypothetical protein
MDPAEEPRSPRAGDELPDDLGARPGDTLDLGGAPNQTTGLLDERPRRRGLNRLLHTGWRQPREPTTRFGR